MSGNGDDEQVPYAQYLKSLLEKGILQGTPPVVTTNPNSLEEQAKKVMPKKGWEYIKGGAGEASTMDANRLAFRQWKIVPRVLTPTSSRDLSTTLFGHKYDTPVLMALHWRSVVVPRGQRASTSIEELVEKVPGGPKWFQLYWPLDQEITASILRRARTNGYKVLIVTLDTWTLAWRPYDLDPASVPFIVGEGDDVGFNDPVFRRKFAERTDGEKPEESKVQAGMYWCSEVFPGVSRSWEDLKILKEYWDGPIVLKGVLCVEDARLAVEHGMDGLIVSTHGGRQLDGAVGTLDVLPDIADAVGDKITVMVDSGVRTGADVLKAVALGAKGVFLGRPVVYGLGIDGAAGAEAVIAGILADFDLTMGFSGARTLADIKRSLLKRVSYPGDVKSNL
ncbi:hypothetical protein ED733_004743 [Metarhizium rileyi]|uniref:FMN hydroxy acid dehydrogenase domain-containing protein n=1 Tax=Metarhizium rileyi (strain RCEF 4871) TaxID=1649241 RepID=A0A5C6GAT2_METRR|nr:hypothetical protein ED733_004743 [Metarhizium rileyi]